MKLELRQLKYPQTSRFTIPYLPHAFYVVTFCLVGILIPLNIALVGSDVVTTLRSDPTAHIDPWWMTKSWPAALRPRSLPQTCQPASITDDVSLRTNSSVPLFKYTLMRASLAGTGDNLSNRIYPAPYMGNPLKDCEVTSILMKMTIPIDIMTYTFTVTCSLGGKKDYSFRVPDNVTFTGTHNRAVNADLGPDDMLSYLAFDVVPEAKGKFRDTSKLKALALNSSSPVNVIGVLDAMQSDLFNAVYLQRAVYNRQGLVYNTTHIVEWAGGKMCRLTSDSDVPCANATDPNRLSRWYETTNGATIYDADFMYGFQVTLFNVFISLRDALLLDLGNIDNTSNIYLNKSAFNTLIRTDSFFDSSWPILSDYFNSSADYWLSCTWGWNCMNTTSWANALRSASENASLNNLTLPWKPSVDLSTQPSMLGFSYLCPTLQKKPLGSFLISVFVATATMLGVAYSIFETVMPEVEKQYQSRKATRGVLGNPNHEGQQAMFIQANPTTRDLSQTLQSPAMESPYKDNGYQYPYSTEYQPVSLNEDYGHLTHNHGGK